MLKSTFLPIVEQKMFLIESAKGDQGECYLHIYKIYVICRVARGNRTVLINEVIFTIFIF